MIREMTHVEFILVCQILYREFMERRRIVQAKDIQDTMYEINLYRANRIPLRYFYDESTNNLEYNIIFPRRIH